MPETSSQTRILFNNTFEFNSDNEWVDDENAQAGSNEVDVESIALHEMGHLLGLAHINQQSAVMFSQYQGGRRILTDYDKESFGNLYLQGVVTSIGDEIEITSGPTIVASGQTATYWSSFIDYTYPFNDGSITTWYWRIIARHSDGWYEYATTDDGTLTSYSTSSKWVFNFTANLPDNYEWIHDENDNVWSKVRVSGQDNEGYWHYDELVIGLDYTLTPPAIPKNFAGSWSNNHPRMDWDANTEPDFAHYEVWKKKDGVWSLRTTTTNNFYTDNSETKFTGIPLKKYIEYKVRSVDTQSKNSLYTHSEKFLIQDLIPQESNNIFTQNSDIINVIDYSLLTNYPNPFNPSTKITFSIPELSFVTLKVFDISGRLIESLSESSKQKGFYTYTFNGSNLSSGIYIYKFTALGKETGKTYNNVKRMLLVK